MHVEYSQPFPLLAPLPIVCQVYVSQLFYIYIYLPTCSSEIIVLVFVVHCFDSLFVFLSFFFWLSMYVWLICLCRCFCSHGDALSQFHILFVSCLDKSSCDSFPPRYILTEIACVLTACTCCIVSPPPPPTHEPQPLTAFPSVLTT